MNWRFNQRGTDVWNSRHGLIWDFDIRIKIVFKRRGRMLWGGRFFLSNTLMLALVWIVVGSEGFLASVLASMYSIYPKHPCDWSIWVGNQQHQKDNMYQVVVWRVGLISLLVYVIRGFKSRTMDIFNFQVIYKFYWQFNFGEKNLNQLFIYWVLLNTYIGFWALKLRCNQ